MKARALLDSLRGRVSAEEWAALADEGAPLVISQWNREALLRMRARADVAGEVPEARVQRMEALLRDYLDRYMADRPEGHKWIELSCLYLAFIAREPLHPAGIVGRRLARRGGREIWLCPAREEGPDSLCGFCVCRRTDGDERERNG